MECSPKKKQQKSKGYRLIDPNYLNSCSVKRKAAFTRLAKELGKKPSKLSSEDIEQSGVCWSYSSPKRKYESWCAAKTRQAEILTATEVFPCPDCFHWHIGTLPKLAEGDEFFFIDPYTPPIEYREPPKPTPPRKLEKLRGIQKKYA